METNEKDRARVLVMNFG